MPTSAACRYRRRAVRRAGRNNADGAEIIDVFFALNQGNEAPAPMASATSSLQVERPFCAADASGVAVALPPKNCSPSLYPRCFLNGIVAGDIEVVVNDIAGAALTPAGPLPFSGPAHSQWLQCQAQPLSSILTDKHLMCRFFLSREHFGQMALCSPYAVLALRMPFAASSSSTVLRGPG